DGTTRHVESRLNKEGTHRTERYGATVDRHVDALIGLVAQVQRSVAPDGDRGARSDVVFLAVLLENRGAGEPVSHEHVPWNHGPVGRVHERDPVQDGGRARVGVAVAE